MGVFIVAPERTVYFAKITRDLRLWPFRDELLNAIDPLRTTSRFHRTWRFSRPIEIEGFVAAELGFIRSARAIGLSYDEERLLFVTTEGTANEGSFSLFVVDTAREIVAFEARPPEIRLQSFIGAFSKLLREAGFNASVTPLPDTAGFHDWVATVDRLVRVRVFVQRPNPGWHHRATLEREALVQADAGAIEMVAVAPPDGTINADAEWIEGGLGQVSEHGQGKVSAIGQIGQLRHKWSSGASPRTASIPDDPEATPDQIMSRLIRKVRELYGE